MEPAEWKQARISPISMLNHKVLSKCKDTRYLKTFETPFNNEEIFVMRPCHHNDVVALHNRYLKSTPVLKANQKLIKRLTDEFIDLILPHFTGRMTPSQFLHTKTGKLGVRYRTAAQDIIENGFDINRNNDIKMFIKNEKYPELKPPRAIMGRNPTFNIAYGTYTVPIETAMSKLPQFTKGRNFLERGELFDSLTGEWYLENDYSKYESSQRITLLDLIEKRILKTLYPGDAFIMNLYESKLMKKGVTSNGIKFVFQGCRGSGDMDTGLFNSILNWVACRYFEISNNFPWKGKFIVDGDDGVLKSPRGVENFINTFAHFGFEAKLELRQDYHDVNFCSSKFLQIRPGVYYQTQDLNKILTQTKFLINSKFYESLQDYYSSLGYMYSVLYNGFPVFDSFSQFLKTCGNTYVKTEMLESHYGAYEAFKLSTNSNLIDKDLIRAEIALCYNISHTQQYEIENWFLTNRLNFPPSLCKPYRAQINNKGLKHYDDEIYDNMFLCNLTAKKVDRSKDLLY